MTESLDERRARLAAEQEAERLAFRQLAREHPNDVPLMIRVFATQLGNLHLYGFWDEAEAFIAEWQAAQTEATI